METTFDIYIMAVTKARTGLGLDWRWTGDGLEHFSFLTHLNIYFNKVTDIIEAPCSYITWMLALCEPMELAVNCELDHVQY